MTAHQLPGKQQPQLSEVAAHFQNSTNRSIQVGTTVAV